MQLQHGIYSQEAISNYDYIDGIVDTLGYANPFDYIAKYSTDGKTYYNNTYKFWAMGLLKRSWTWGGLAFASTERVPFFADRHTGIYDIKKISPSYATRFKKLLRYFAQWNPHLGQHKQIIVTLFEFNSTAWSNHSPDDQHPETSWCKTGFCKPNDPSACISCGHSKYGNPWYPGNNSNTFQTLPWGYYNNSNNNNDPHYNDTNLAWEFFPDPDSPGNAQSLIDAQEAYVRNICQLIKDAYDGQNGHPDQSHISDVIIELMHEPPADGDNYLRIQKWLLHFRTYAEQQFTQYVPTFSWMVNDSGAGMSYVPYYIQNYNDLIVSEGHTESWWSKHDCSLYIGTWINTLNGYFQPDFNHDDIFLDTDGNGLCRNDPTALNDAVTKAAQEGCNFMHLEPACDANGNPQRNDAALQNIATAYKDYEDGIH